MLGLTKPRTTCMLVHHTLTFLQACFYKSKHTKPQILRILYSTEPIQWNTLKFPFNLNNTRICGHFEGAVCRWGCFWDKIWHILVETPWDMYAPLHGKMTKVSLFKWKKRINMKKHTKVFAQSYRLRRSTKNITNWIRWILQGDWGLSGCIGKLIFLVI